MEAERIRYRKLPGRRRGFLFGSSVWMAPDHLLLVKSVRFREDYKRFYFRDIQAIVTADAPRFHISTRGAAIFVLCMIAVGVASNPILRVPDAGKVAVALSILFLGLVWAYVSAKSSCRCRIYTAVSSDELPSLYRRWNARKFLDIVAPMIAQAQGVLEGNWAEAVEGRQIGPIAEGRVGLAMPVPGGALTTPVAAPLFTAAASNTPLSNFFVGSLCLGGLADLGSIRFSGPAGRWVLLSTLLVQLAAAVAVLVQNYLGKARPAMRNLAIAALVSMGVWYYAVQIGAQMAVAIQNAHSQNKVFPGQAQAWTLFEHPLARETAGGFTLLLGLAGVILALRGHRAPEEKVSFNV